MPRTLLQRYAPLLVIVGLQALMFAFAPSATTTVVRDSAGAASPGAAAGGANSGNTGSAATNGPAAGGGGSAQTSGGGVGRTTAASGGTGQQAAQVAQSGPSQQVDALGRPLTGDRSKCAPGGMLQDGLVTTSPPCMPKFTGDNGGATYQGVTRDSIEIVAIHPDYGPAVNQALTAGGLEASHQQWQELDGMYAGYLNKHYELYGRRIHIDEYYPMCSDAACFRAEAKALNARFHPFLTIYEAPNLMPQAMGDQLSQLGVVFESMPSTSDAWMRQHAPYGWDTTPQGDRIMDMLADYYCKKLYGKNATLAGDPAMRLRRRKLGILGSDDPNAVEMARHLYQQVTGGRCGGPNDGTTIYTYSSDPVQAQSEASTLTTRMKNDGITTRGGPIGSPGSQEDDKQQYFPENLLSFPNGDDDLVGRLLGSLGSTQQRSHTFGIGWAEKARPTAEQDWQKVIHEMDPNYSVPYIAKGTWLPLSMFGDIIQWTGPRLTPATLARGARNGVQINGWLNPRPWAGWKCCNPYGIEWNFNVSPDSYTAETDARQVYWSDSAISAGDNQPGAWVCPDPDCHRYEVGQWPVGEPEQP